MSQYQAVHLDVGDIRYGALFIRDEGHYADVVEVTDLDSATETTGMVLIEQGSLSIEYAGNFAAQRRRFRSAIDTIGSPSLTGLTRQNARMLAYSALWEYGYRDIEESHVLAERDVDQKQDGWEAEDFADDPAEVWGFLADNFDIERESTS